jgi:hypothetical protein
LLVLTIALLLWAVIGPTAALVTLRVLACAIFLNIGWRALVLARLLRGQENVDGLGGSS